MNQTNDQAVTRGFFRKHHAIPATGAGPDFANATDDALRAWARGGDEGAIRECRRRMERLMAEGGDAYRIGGLCATLAMLGR
jgi:hypothetical protein